MLRRLRNTSRVAGVLLGLCALLRLGSACVDGPTAASAGDGFLLTPDNVVLTAVADTVRLSAGNGPSDAAAGAIAWSTSDSTVAVVDSTGLVTAVANGAALVTARQGASSDRAVVVVSQVPVRVAVSPSNVMLSGIGTQAHLSALAYDRTDHLIPATDVIWSSTDPLVAEVSSDGTVTARGAGEVRIHATVFPH